MKKSYLVHLFWAFVAIAAFAIGSKSSDSPDSDDDTAGANNRNSATGLSSRSRGGPEGSSGASRTRTKTSRSGSPASPSDIALSDADIRNLGNQLKSAKGPLERREAFIKLLANLTPENAKLMREQITHLDSDSSEFRDFHYQWGAIAGEEAVLNGAETRERDMATTLAGWAAADPDAALAYFNGLEKGAQNGSGMKWGAVYGLMDADPNLAVRFAIDQKEAGDKEAGRLMDSIARRMIRDNDPAQAASWASTLPAGEIQDAAIYRVAREYADEDPVATLSWANTLPEGNARNRAVRESFSEWAQRSPEEAANRLGSMNASPERDSATYGYATRVAWENPAVGVEWANTISDEGTRANALMETGRAYFRKDPEAAKQWLTSSGLTPEQQKRVTDRSRRRW